MITFYDIASSLVGQTFSPNPGKTRVELNYRGLPYTTLYLEYPDIEATCKKIGAPPTTKKADGTDYYTLPVIHDSATGKAIADSLLISEYLEETYPDTPRLFPSPTISSNTLSVKAALTFFEQFFMQNVFAPLLPAVLAECNAALHPPSAAYFRNTREVWYGAKLEDLSPKGSEKRAQDWEKVKDGLNKVACILDQSGGEYFLGDVFSRAEVILIAFLSAIPSYVEKEEWEPIANANGRRWGKLLEKTKALQMVKD